MVAHAHDNIHRNLSETVLGATVLCGARGAYMYISAQVPVCGAQLLRTRTYISQVRDTPRFLNLNSRAST